MLLKNEQQQELKYSAIFSALKKDKKVQQTVTRLGKTEDWVILRQFISELKQTLLEATLEVDSIDDIRRYKFLIKGMESIVILPWKRRRCSRPFASTSSWKNSGTSPGLLLSSISFAFSVASPGLPMIFGVMNRNISVEVSLISVAENSLPMPGISPIPLWL